MTKISGKSHMADEKSNFMFDLISGIYAMFYGHQVKKFRFAVSVAQRELDISMCKSALDVGCGTGAFCSVLAENGIEVTGLDNSKKMLVIAQRKNRGHGINFMHHDALRPLPFPDGSFDLATASYVAHGLTPESRKKMLNEMKRVAKHYVVLHEYGKRRKITTDVIERLEGGNYFGFIENIESELGALFDKMITVEVAENALWYILQSEVRQRRE